MQEMWFWHPTFEQLITNVWNLGHGDLVEQIKTLQKGMME